MPSIISNENLKGDYWRVKFSAPDICAQAQAGQFVHVRLPLLRDRILRRPFSICDASDDGVLTLVYKVVGAGTERLKELRPGDGCDILGPLGKPFSEPDADTTPVLVAGGYGSAATLLLAKRARRNAILLLGARSKDDLILVEEYRELGVDVRVATNDGSEGRKGFVTELLDGVLDELKAAKSKYMIYGCGPDMMLMALGRKTCAMKVPAELSLDHHMGCGVGACFACVVRVKDKTPDGWRYARACKEGPVFNAEDVYYG